MPTKAAVKRGSAGSTRARPTKSSAKPRKKAPAAGGAAALPKVERRGAATKAAPGMVKLVLEDDEGDVETPWVTPVAKNRYRMENTPFFAYGVSYLDIVEARPRRGEPRPVFRRVVEPSGHATVRVAAATDGPVPRRVVNPLVKLGCTYEGTSPSYLCFDVPPGVELAKVVEVLMKFDDSVIEWEHANPTWEALYGKKETKRSRRNARA